MQKWRVSIAAGALIVAQTSAFAEGSQSSSPASQISRSRHRSQGSQDSQGSQVTPASKASEVVPKIGANHTYSEIQGSARTSTDMPMVGATVRLRDARRGHIVASAVTDKTGAYAFQSLDPGTYIVELLGPDQTVITASQLINVNAGETVAAAVKLPFKIPPFGGVLGHSAASAAVIAATAAASGLLATAVSGNAVSPRQ
jgi:hypothetical protein